ncbi:MAG: GAF domain-containing protein [Rhodospirillaceae bacterium]|nr:GAF domain-containing protein [Rhodospirillaceae bacterium]
MTAIDLTSLRASLEGAIPSEIATCDAAGIPNVSVISDVHFVDPEHVAISYQFFSKTRANILANPWASVLLKHPHTCAQHRVSLRYLRTEHEGPLFETMKAKLAGIASHEGMSGIFRLLGADIYRVMEIELVRGDLLPLPQPPVALLSALRASLGQLRFCRDVDSLVATLLACLEREFRLPHVMLLMADPSCDRLYTVASQGYPESGVGAEILPGQGVIGVAARERTPIRLTHATRDYLYGRAIRDALRASPMAAQLETEIPLPGLSQSGSQIAVPILGPAPGRDGLLGVLYAESPEEGRFGYDEEDALMILAGEIAAILRECADAAENAQDIAPPVAAVPVTEGQPLTIRHYRADDSIFIDDAYLIKGVAGAILWHLLGTFERTGRVEFSNKELRLAPQIRLPEFSENLEARLILLRRRLAERSPHLVIDKAGRGRFRLNLARPVRLIEAEA